MPAAVIVLFAAAMAGAPNGSAAAPAGAAPAAAPQVSPAVVPEPKKDPMKQVICRRMEVTGSRLGGGDVCCTRAQWEELTRRSQQTIRDVQTQGQFTRDRGG